MSRLHVGVEQVESLRQPVLPVPAPGWWAESKKFLQCLVYMSPAFIPTPFGSTAPVFGLIVLVRSASGLRRQRRDYPYPSPEDP